MIRPLETLSPMKKIDILSPCVLCLILLCSVALAAQDKSANAAPSPNNTPNYKNPALSIDDRVADLLGRMTLEEKVEQICGGSRTESQVIDPTGTYTTESARAVLNR